MQTLLKYLYMSLANRSSKYFPNNIKQKQTYQLCDAIFYKLSRKFTKFWSLPIILSIVVILSTNDSS